MNAPINDMHFSPGHAQKQSLIIPLVPATFNGDASGEYLLHIISDLKNFYLRRNFSHEERFGAPDPFSEAVLEDLNKAYASTRQWLEQAHHCDVHSRLESSISLRLVEE